MQRVGDGASQALASGEGAARLVLPQSPLIRQNGYVVDDLDKSVRDWTAQFGIGPFFCIRHMVLDDVRYRGQPAELDISVALYFDGDLCIELIEQHNGGPSAYRDMVPVGARGFHHLLVYPQNYDQELARYEEKGIAVAGSGVLRSSGLRCAYLDTQATLGCMLELVSRDAPAQWVSMKQACLACALGPYRPSALRGVLPNE